MGTEARFGLAGVADTVGFIGGVLCTGAATGAGKPVGCMVPAVGCLVPDIIGGLTLFGVAVTQRFAILEGLGRSLAADTGELIHCLFGTGSGSYQIGCIGIMLVEAVCCFVQLHIGVMLAGVPVRIGVVGEGGLRNMSPHAGRLAAGEGNTVGFVGCVLCAGIAAGAGIPVDVMTGAVGCLLKIGVGLDHLGIVMSEGRAVLGIALGALGAADAGVVIGGVGGAGGSVLPLGLILLIKGVGLLQQDNFGVMDAALYMLFACDGIVGIGNMGTDLALKGLDVGNSGAARMGAAVIVNIMLGAVLSGGLQGIAVLYFLVELMTQRAVCLGEGPGALFAADAGVIIGRVLGAGGGGIKIFLLHDLLIKDVGAHIALKGLGIRNGVAVRTGAAVIVNVMLGAVLRGGFLGIAVLYFLGKIVTQRGVFLIKGLGTLSAADAGVIIGRVLGTGGGGSKIFIFTSL